MYNADVKADRLCGALFPEGKRFFQFIKTNIAFVCLQCETTSFFSFDLENVVKLWWFKKPRFEKRTTTPSLASIF